MVQNKKVKSSGVKNKPEIPNPAEKKQGKPGNEEYGYVLEKKNYILLIVGFLLIVIGFILMTGGSTDDPNVFSFELYSFRRITLAPILVLLGFAIEIFAIMWIPRKKIKL